MKKWIFTYCLISLFLIFSEKPAYNQTYSIINDVYWSTQNQNMWGPNGSPFNINQTISLFDVTFDTTLTFGYMDTILGLPTGALFTLDTWFEIGSTFEMTGFTTGWIDVNYPVEIELTFPDNYTWNPGQIVTVNSEYEVLPGWYLHSQFPHAGVISLDLDFGFDLDLDATVCLGGCTDFEIIDVHVPLDSIVIFYINGQTGEVIYPCWNGTFVEFCHDTLLPITFTNLGGIGLSGEITLPYIETTDWLDISDPCSQTIWAQGDSTWIELDLDIIQFLYAIAGLIPPPQGPAIQQFLTMLSGTYNFGGGITIEYNLLSASMEMESTMQQDLSFHPTVWTTLSFPTPVQYVVNNPHTGYSIVDSGFSDNISFPTCSDLNFVWPCFGFPQMDIGIEHSISPTFTNHTWDSLAFTFILTALEFDINIPFPFTKTMSEVEIPELCIDIPVIYKNNDSTTIEICLPEIVHPEIDTLVINEFKDGAAKWNIHIGPLVDLSIPLGYIPITWYNNTWELEGNFNDTIVQGTSMIPNLQMEILNINGNDVVCAGDTSGNVSITIQYGTPPYTYTWSNGYTNTTNMPTDTMYNAGAGTYFVTVSDVSGCTLTGQFSLIEVNPPIFSTLSGMNVLCTGDSTGIISSTVWGGTPPYSYAWTSPGGTSPTAVNIPAGTYILTVTDAVGCTITDTLTITEPPLAINVVIDNTVDILCYGNNTGSIEVSVSGGTPGYSYLWNTGYWMEDIFNIQAGTYTLTVTDANGCKFIITETVDQPPLLETYITGANVSCYGFADGVADLNVSGGVTPYTFIWSTGSATEDISGLIAGTYSVTVTDAHNCTSTSVIVISQPYAPLEGSIEPTHVLCYGDYTGAANLTITGGTVPYQYSWNSGQTSQDLFGIPAGLYTVTITDLHNCELIIDIQIIEPAAPLNVMLDSHDVNCFGENNGYITTVVSGGTSPYLYNWSNGSVEPDVYYLIEGTYSVTVTDSHGCTFVVQTYIDEPDKLFASTDTSVTICIGETATLIGSATGGTPPYNHFWSNGQTIEIIQVNPVQTTSYSYYVTDSRGCVSNTSTVIVNVNPPLSLELFADDYYICPGDPLYLTVNVSGGSGNYQYILNDTISIWLPATIYPSESGSLIIQLSDDCGTPVATDEIFVEILSSPFLTMNADIYEGCRPLTVYFNEISPDIGQSYHWDFSDIYSVNYSAEKNPVHIFTQAGVYDVSLTVTSDSGCVTSNTFNDMITVFETPEANFIMDPSVVNVIYPIVFFYNISENAYYYNWYFGDGDSSHMFSPYHTYPDLPATYNVVLVAINDFGCKDTVHESLIVKGNFTFYAPTAFSPDEDGINDFFIVKGTGIDENRFQLLIYNRWGEVVFETDKINQSWDGKIKGHNIAKNGVYTWYAVFKDENGLGHEESGTVTIIR
ncbi:MAG: PKD domain-containing protein [Bacteroidota bacterium]